MEQANRVAGEKGKKLEVDQAQSPSAVWGWGGGKREGGGSVAKGKKENN